MRTGVPSEVLAACWSAWLRRGCRALSVCLPSLLARQSVRGLQCGGWEAEGKEASGRREGPCP